MNAGKEARSEVRVANSDPGSNDQSGGVPSSGAISVDPRRVHDRKPVDLDVGLFSESNFYAGFTENLSVGGVFIATHILKAVGSTVEFVLHLPTSAHPVKGKGEVRWVRTFSERSDMAPGLGVRFLELDAGGEEAIRKFLKHRDPLFYDDLDG
jgi:uncharacterized protein (TIGR02266 family)